MDTHIVGFNPETCWWKWVQILLAIILTYVVMRRLANSWQSSWLVGRSLSKSLPSSVREEEEDEAVAQPGLEATLHKPFSLGHSYHVAGLAHSPVVQTGDIDEVLGHNSTSASENCETACDLNQERKWDSAVGDLKEKVTRPPLLDIGPQDGKKLKLAALLASLQEDLGHFHITSQPNLPQTRKLQKNLERTEWVVQSCSLSDTRAEDGQRSSPRIPPIVNASLTAFNLSRSTSWSPTSIPTSVDETRVSSEGSTAWEWRAADGQCRRRSQSRRVSLTKNMRRRTMTTTTNLFAERTRRRLGLSLDNFASDPPCPSPNVRNTWHGDKKPPAVRPSGMKRPDTRPSGVYSDTIEHSAREDTKTPAVRPSDVYSDQMERSIMEGDRMERSVMEYMKTLAVTPPTSVFDSDQLEQSNWASLFAAASSPVGLTSIVSSTNASSVRGGGLLVGSLGERLNKSPSGNCVVVSQPDLDGLAQHRHRHQQMFFKDGSRFAEIPSADTSMDTSSVPGGKPVADLFSPDRATAELSSTRSPANGSLSSPRVGGLFTLERLKESPSGNYVVPSQPDLEKEMSLNGGSRLAERSAAESSEIYSAPGGKPVADLFSPNWTVAALSSAGWPVAAADLSSELGIVKKKRATSLPEKCSDSCNSVLEARSGRSFHQTRDGVHQKMPEPVTRPPRVPSVLPLTLPHGSKPRSSPAERSESIISVNPFGLMRNVTPQTD